MKLDHSRLFAAPIVLFVVLLQAGEAVARPNIVFIFTDDQAPFAAGAAGDERFITPNIDRIFHEGAHLPNSFVTTPVCSPSRVGLMTSRYGTEMGITDFLNARQEKQLGLDPQTPTWPKLLADAGYRNGLFGKWHLGLLDKYHPTRMGYHCFLGIRGGGCPPKDPTLEMLDGQVRKVAGYTCDIFTDHALQFIRENHQRPFLVSLHFRAPHAAWLPVRPEDWEPFKDLDPRIPNPNYPNLDVALVKKRTREYLASVKSVDRNVGRVLSLLEQLQLADNTVVIFTSDHGYNLGEHGVWYKGNAIRALTKNPPQQWSQIPAHRRPNLWDTSLRVPTAVRWPGVIQPGSKVARTVSNLDWFPTLLAMAGVELPHNITVRGRDITPLLRRKTVDWDDDLYVEYSMHHGATTHMRGFRTPRWKYMRDFANTGREELYDLRNDPGETTNLAGSADPHHRRIKSRLGGKILQHMQRIEDPLLAHRQSHHQLISSIGSERATSGNGNKIVTAAGKTHVVWQDANEEGYFARIRTLDHQRGTWSQTYTLGKGRDNHARPTITVDSQGYLHVIIGGHHSGLQYRRSLRPGDASQWTAAETFGKTTYPVLLCGPGDTLYLTGRHDSQWKGMDFYAKRPGHPWEHSGLLVAKQKRYKYYAAYHNALAWGPNRKTLHMSVGFFLGYSKRQGEHNRDPQGMHQAVGYMRSIDGGQTWASADGQLIQLPATTETIDLIDEGIRPREAMDQPKPGIRHCGIAVDSQNRPYVVYLRHTPDPGRIFLVTPDGSGQWKNLPLSTAVREHWPDLVPVECNVSMTRDDVLCLMLTLAPRDHPHANWNPGIYGRPAFWLRDYPNIQRIVWLQSDDGGRTFDRREILPHDPHRGTLIPTLERPTGFHGVAAGELPPLLYFEGLSRYREPGEIIQNDVYYVQPISGEANAPTLQLR